MCQKHKQEHNNKVTSEGYGVWEVQSFNPKKKQLWYRIVLDEETGNISCGCSAWKYSKDKLLCKHMMAVIEEEVKV